VDISPPDDSVDTNAIIIEGEGDIFSFGTGPGGFVNKRIVFRPAHPPPVSLEPAPKAEITLHHNPPQLVLITNNQRKITEECYGLYACNDQGNWFELYFTPTGATALENRLTELERRLSEAEAKLSAAPPKRKPPRREGD
jgi:hypothetical protein